MERAIALKEGAEHERSKAQTELGRYKTEREMGSQIKRVKKRQCKSGFQVKREMGQW